MMMMRMMMMIVMMMMLWRRKSGVVLIVIQIAEVQVLECEGEDEGEEPERWAWDARRTVTSMLHCGRILSWNHKSITDHTPI